MKETKTNTMDFNSRLQLREAFIKKIHTLESATESNKIWQDTNASTFLDYGGIEETPFDEIVWIIDHCFEQAHENLDDKVFNKYYSALISKLSENYDNWNLVQKIQDGTLPVKDWPNYNRYLEASAKAKAKFDASPEAIQLKQLQEEWRNILNAPRGNFSDIDWSLSANRIQFSDWLNSCSDEEEAKWLLDEIDDDSTFFEYEDFCLSAPWWFTYDEDGFFEWYGLLNDLSFLLKHTNELSSCAILEVAISNGLSDAIKNHPEEMLTILKENGHIDNFPEQIVKALEEKWPEIPDELQEDYKQFFDELKEYYC